MFGHYRVIVAHGGNRVGDFFRAKTDDVVVSALVKAGYLRLEEIELPESTEPPVKRGRPKRKEGGHVPSETGSGEGPAVGDSGGDESGPVGS